METKSSPEKRRENNILPVFDPRPSAVFAAELLEAIGQKGILIGRLAVWTFLKDTGDHGYTKDLDIAVSEQSCLEIRKYLKDKDVRISNLLIGGINVKSRADNNVNIDFIDRSSEEWGNYGSLFREAIAEAVRNNRTIRLDDRKNLYVVSLEYLILMKLLTLEKKDEEDAKLLLRLTDPDINRIRNIISNHPDPPVRTRLEIIRTRLEIILRDMNHKESKLLRYKDRIS